MAVGRHTKKDFYLKADFISYLQNKDLAGSTQKAYCFSVEKFLQWYRHEPINCTKKDVLKYLEHLQNNRQQEHISRKNALIALNHYFSFLQRSEAIENNPTALLKIRGTKKRTLYKLYTPEELTQLFDTYYTLFIQNFDERCFASKLGGIPANMRQQAFLVRNRSAVMLSILIHQGATTKELQTLLVEDIDLIKATIKLRGGKKSNDRTLPLHASQIGLLMHYIQNIRPQFLSYCSPDSYRDGKLFLALPELGKKATQTESVVRCFKSLTEQVRSIDKTLINFKQVRASVITHWLKVEGLRKTQYLAGHRYISSTEKYLPNQIEGLIDDVAKYNPF